MKNRKTNILTFALDPTGDDFRIKGYAIRYNVLSKINEDSLGKWATKIVPHSFSDSLKKRVDVYLEHDNKQLLASTKNESLTLTEDDNGVAFDVFLGNSMLQKDVFNLVQQGLYDSMSFGVQIKESEWVTETHNGEDIDVRVIKSGEVFEISIVSNPAFDSTSLMVASNDDAERKEFVETKEREEVAAEELQKAKDLKEAEDLKLAQETKQNETLLSIQKAKLKVYELNI
jgi:HK97 family phage prohead protease